MPTFGRRWSPAYACGGARGGHVGGERGLVVVRGGAGRARAVGRELRAETVGDSGARRGPAARPVRGSVRCVVVGAGELAVA